MSDWDTLIIAVVIFAVAIFLMWRVSPILSSVGNVTTAISSLLVTLIGFQTAFSST